MSYEVQTVTGVDGDDIFRCRWLPEGQVRGSLTLVHGYGEHCGRYEAFVDEMLSLGIAVYAYDQRGHGRSGGKMGYISSFRGLLPELIRVLRWAAEEQPNRPRILFGHSMGGALAALAAAEAPERVDLCIITGPPLKLSEDLSPLLQKIAGVLGTIAPRLPASKLDPDRVSRDPEVVRAYERDPLVYHGMVPARSGHQLLGIGEEVLSQAGGIECPLLVLHGSEDVIAVPAGSEELVAKASSKDKTLKFYAGLFHEILNEPEQSVVRADIRDWLEQRLAS